jgi:ADP-heptose:LPS heptosyltransferase
MSMGANGGQLQSDRGNPRLKFLDRYAGIPVIAALGLRNRIRGPRPVPRDWHSIGLIKTVGIGDIVLLSAVVRDLRVARPDARIVVFVSANNAGFARLLDDVDVVTVPVRNLPEAVRIVRAEHCDVVVDFGAWPRFESMLTALSGARATVGMRTPGQHRHAAYDVVVDHETGHEIDNYRRLIAAAGITSTSDPHLVADAAAPRLLDAPYVVLHLWPGGANFDERSWPEERWHEIALALNERGYDVVLTGGPGDVMPSDAVVARWRAEGIRVHTAAGASPEATVIWLHQAVGLISVNTGIMHLGAALGVPVVVLNGPTSARRWGPLATPSRTVASPMVPDGYLNLGWERDDRYRDCMLAITVDAVTAAWDDLMAEVAGTPPRFGIG